MQLIAVDARVMFDWRALYCNDMPIPCLGSIHCSYLLISASHL